MTETCIPTIVAHRGFAERYPENTLIASRAALEAGVNYIEIDIQLSADHVPFLLHDHSLLRTAGYNSLITAINSSDISSPANATISPNNKNGRFITPPRLQEYVDLLVSWPEAHTFVELKIESLSAFGYETVSQAILSTLQPILNRCIIISYDLNFLHYLQLQSESSTNRLALGWILTKYDDTHYRQARQLHPDYLICNHEKIESAQLWQGPWKWLLYEVKYASLAVDLCRKGADMVETMAIENLLQDSRFTPIVE